MSKMATNISHVENPYIFTFLKNAEYVGNTIYQIKGEIFILKNNSKSFQQLTVYYLSTSQYSPLESSKSMCITLRLLYLLFIFCTISFHFIKSLILSKLFPNCFFLIYRLKYKASVVLCLTTLTLYYKYFPFKHQTLKL